jgi:hypothetical protein
MRPLTFFRSSREALPVLAVCNTRARSLARSLVFHLHVGRGWLPLLEHRRRPAGPAIPHDTNGCEKHIIAPPLSPFLSSNHWNIIRTTHAHAPTPTHVLCLSRNRNTQLEKQQVANPLKKKVLAQRSTPPTPPFPLAQAPNRDLCPGRTRVTKKGAFSAQRGREREGESPGGSICERREKKKTKGREQLTRNRYAPPRKHARSLARARRRRGARPPP